MTIAGDDLDRARSRFYLIRHGQGAIFRPLRADALMEVLVSDGEDYNQFQVLRASDVWQVHALERDLYATVVIFDGPEQEDRSIPLARWRTAPRAMSRAHCAS